jgi:hypothetical protein
MKRPHYSPDLVPNIFTFVLTDESTPRRRELQIDNEPNHCPELIT